MPQEEFKTGGVTANTTGTICQETSLYKCTDNKVEYIEFIAAGEPFPNFPGGNGKGKASWFKLTLANDGARKTFAAVKADFA
jgi:hypothetical protein